MPERPPEILSPVPDVIMLIGIETPVPVRDPVGTPKDAKVPDTVPLEALLTEIPVPEYVLGTVTAMPFVAAPVTARAVEPLLAILNTVVVEKVLPVSVVEPMANNVVAVELALAWIANLANGDEVATPSAPVVASANAVEVAGSVPKRILPMLSWLLFVDDAKKILLPIPMLPSPVVRLLVLTEAPSKMFAYPVVIALPA